ncbi:cation:proton antiporter [Sulfurirhabdus autotrophica]|uniref:Transporter (CPA2 family) n=1 Tax=Sulfurirhabdus autotrophica TaxID=1706046 RepID=A0A4R3Y753_9PROT|nr:cation:proton antiporter [Sulfurirhabdus autotrophica]TCV87452.1 transporter (CPA2 family) [Sulfurirhabdus autotrophica]
MSSSAASLAQTSVHHTEALLFFTLLQLAVIVIFSRIGNEVASRFAQSRVVGEIIIGILLGPSLFGLLAPDLFNYVFHSSSQEPITMLSQIGLILLMFQIGLEFDFSHLTTSNNRNAVIRIAAAGLIFPFVLGFIFGYYSAPILSPGAAPMATALFTATAFSITALPILGRIMIEFNMTRLPLGVIAISAAAINDVIGWLLLAIVTALAVSNFSMENFFITLVQLVMYIVVSWWVVRPLLRRAIRHSVVTEHRFSANLLGVIIAAIFLSAMMTYKIGIFAIFGGFMMGVLLHDQLEIVKAWRKKVGEFVTVFFLPIFFTYTGLRTNIGGLDSIALWGWCLLLISLATIGKFGGCYWAARWSGMNHAQSKVIGIMMNTRALMELIIINVGYDLGVISQNMFTMLVLMAIVSTVITTPGLRRWLPGAGIPIPARQHLAD